MYLRIVTTNEQFGMVFEGRVSCTGTVIARQWVVTAAHCVEHMTDNTTVEILFDSLNHTQATVAVADRVEIAPTYRSEGRRNEPAPPS